MRKKNSYALISTFDKSGLRQICNNFKKNNISIISTGATGQYIKKNGFKCISVESLTQFKEILDGRIKTLHPKIYASLLFKRENKQHVKTFNTLNFPKIDFVIINLYPFKKTINQKSKIDECIEMIDIGGPSLLRASAKNFYDVTTICDSKYYKKFLQDLNKNNGSTSLNFRKQMSQKVFEHTSSYDKTISDWLDPKTKTLNLNREIELKYGENPNQKASIFLKSKQENIFENILNNKKIGYNNILDIDANLNCLNEFSQTTCVIIKHNNPCGVAVGKSPLEAFKKAYECDPISAFGGIVGFNKKINIDLAKILKKYFFEVIIGKGFDIKSRELFASKKNLILINSKNFKIDKKLEIRSINNGFLKQQKNLKPINKTNIQSVSIRKSKDRELNDLIFALKICKHIKSNSIVIAKNLQTLGIGAGQMSRIDAVKISISKISKKFQTKRFVAASDAFFPFNDSIKLLIKKNCKAIIQPKGSKNDGNVIKLANEKKISLYFVNYRFFKH
ncbi:bifunctional phosphoribosylaminoimidazolecarboxamide formyltransferase/IMP cyclohydrolase [Alphaproteobacteria bacterium]|nr:bifunctional phosphoribosylaminoimidazolecarboxamide formyltransferase/IMP cyclohydrolase [Alphaproteobacteria bacterium]